MKVGFCLEDSGHVDSHGPTAKVYGNHDFCWQGRPDRASLVEGVSAGWRDVYPWDLAFQWVDVSDVQPGSYWLHSDVDPDGILAEGNEGNQAAWAGSATTIPGFVAKAVDAGEVAAGDSLDVSLGAQRFGSPGPARYRIESAPAHGTLDAPAGSWRTSATVAYTPASGFSGTDTFTYAVRDNNSSFPRSPAIATVTISVAPGSTPAPSVQISGAPDSVVAGTSVQLRATVTNDSPGVTWSVDGTAGGTATAGTITGQGLYTAPPQPPAAGVVEISARSARGGRDARTVRIAPVPQQQPAPLPQPEPQPAPPSGGVLGTPPAGRLTVPEAARIGRRLIMSVTSAQAGLVRLNAYAGKRRIGSCVARTPAGRRFTCRLRMPRSMRPTRPVRVVASLRIEGRLVAVRTRAPAPVNSAHVH
jgi:hypothetical protein